MTPTGRGAATVVGLRVTLPRLSALNYGRPVGRDNVSLSTLHDALGLLDEFCSITNLASLLEEGGVSGDELAGLEMLISYRNRPADHSDLLVQLDPTVRSLVAPIVRRVSMNSPLVIELIGSLSAGSLFLLKNPEKIGSWIPRVRAHWFQAQAEAERAKRAYNELKRAGIEVAELED